MDELEKQLINAYPHAQYMQLAFNPNKRGSKTIASHIKEHNFIISESEQNKAIATDKLYTFGITYHDEKVIKVAASTLTHLIGKVCTLSNLTLNNMDDLALLLENKFYTPRGQFYLDGSNINYEKNQEDKMNWSFFARNEFNELCPEFIENHSLTQLFLTIFPSWKVNLEKNLLHDSLIIEAKENKKMKL